MNLRLLNLGCGSRYHQDWVNVDINSESPMVSAHDLKERLPFDDDSFDVVYHSHVLEHLPKAYAPMFCHECFRVLKPGGRIRVVVPDLEQIARIYLELFERGSAGEPIAQTRYDWIVLEMLDQLVRNESGGEMKKYWMQQPMPAMDFVLSRVGSEVSEIISQLRNSKSEDDPHANDGGLNDAYEAIGKFRISGEVHQWMYDRYSLIRLLSNAGFVDIEQRRADESMIPDFSGYQLDLEKDGAVRKPDSLFMEAVKPLSEDNADRTARLERVCRLDAALQKSRSRPPGKYGPLQELENRLRESDADRAARLLIIVELEAQLKEMQADRAAKDDAYYKMIAQLKESEADRAARLELIHTLHAQLKGVQADLEERSISVYRLEAQLKVSEADRAARLELIHKLQAQLQESEAGRAAGLELSHKLQAQLQEGEADRAAGLEAIHRLEAQLQESEADRAARLEVIHQLGAQLEETRAGIEERNNAVRLLTTQLAESEAARTESRAEILMLTSSLSWKLTAPLRWIRSHLLGR